MFAEILRMRGIGRGLLLLLMILFALAPAIALAMRLQEPADPSPATGDGQVVAQGVVPLDDGELAWQVARVEAPLSADADVASAARGFLLADEETVLLADVATGERLRLAPGEATFVEDDGDHVRIALGEDVGALYSLQLVTAGSESGSEDEILFTSEAFASPESDRDVDLIRDRLPAGGSVDVPSGSLPTLILATTGIVSVTTAGGDSVDLAAGEAGSFTGPVAVTAGEEEAVFVAAVVGPAVPQVRIERADSTPVAATPATVATSEPAAATPDAEPTVVETPDAAEPTAAVETPAADATPDAASTEDADEDGLDDAAEADLGTDPTVADSDGDGVLDGAEVNDLGTDPINTDTDADGILDGDEVASGSDPLDGDNVPVATTPDDADGDGFLDAQELELGTDPADPDTDDDGLTDGDEIFIFATGPLNPDNDGDGVLDGDEINNGTDPNDPSSL